MDELYQKLGKVNCWGDKYDSANHRKFEATEIWVDSVSGKTNVGTRDVDVASIPTWLGETSRPGQDEKKQTLVARFVWLDVDDNKRINLADGDIKILKNRFGLKLAYDYAKSCVTGITAFPPVVEPDALQRAFTLCYVPKMVAIWSHRQTKGLDAPSPAITGLLLATKEYKMFLKEVFDANWSIPVCSQPMFPAFCLGIAFSMQVEKTLGTSKADLRGIESKTGYHAFDRKGSSNPAKLIHQKGSDPAQAINPAEELAELSRKSNGHATKLASLGRKTNTLEKLHNFILAQLDEDVDARSERTHDAEKDATDKPGGDAAKDASLGDGAFLLKHHVQVLKNRLEMQVMDLEYTLKRLEVQIDTLFHMVSWSDSISNLMIAEASYRDASSMKTLAVVTMLFLPGSFVSSLFSTDLFDWNSVDLLSSNIGVKSTPQLRLYWAITIPLTLLTFVMYFWWLWFQKKERMKKLGTVKRALASGQEKDETIAMALNYKRQGTRMDSKTGSLA